LRANFSRKYAELAALVVPVAKNPAKIRQTRKINQGGYLRGVDKDSSFILITVVDQSSIRPPRM
jgi:hypothetical protein